MKAAALFPAVARLRGPAGLPARLGLIAFVLLWVLAVLLSARTYTVLADTRAAGDAVRARLMAQVLAQRVDRALSLGIPLDQLVGVPELLQQRLAAYPDVQSIAVQDAAGRTLWHGAARDSQLLKARLPLFALPEVAADAPLAGGVGTVRLVVRSPDLLEFMRSLVLPLTLGCAFFALLSWLAALAAFETSRRLRDRAVRAASRDIGAARYDRLTTTLHRRGFDLRVQQLARAVRAAHETLVRARRVVSSLRRTEPHPARREWLDRLLAEAEGDGRFVASVDAAPALRRVVAADAEAGWSLAMLGCAAGAALTLCAAARAPGSFVAFVWAVGSLAVVPGWLLARRSHVPAVLVLSAAGVLLTLAPWFQVLNGWHGDLLVALGAGLAMGAAGAAASAMQRTARQRPDLLPLARRPWAAKVGAVLGLLGLGPALAGLALMVAQDNSGWLPLAPMFPALLAVACVWRWNAARSPWRTRTRSGPAGAQQTTARTGVVAFGVGLTAAGLLACATGGVAAEAADDLVGLVGAGMLAAAGLLAGLSRPSGARGARSARGVRATRAVAVLGIAVGAAGGALALLSAAGVLGGAAPVGPSVPIVAARSMTDWLAAGLQFTAVPLLAWALGAALRNGGMRGAWPVSRAWVAALASATGALAVGALIAAQPLGVELLREFAPAADRPVVQAKSEARPRAVPSGKAAGDGT